MNITVIGATGMVGTRLVAEATARGHRVIAASRHPGSYPPGDAITAIAVDARERKQLDVALQGADRAVLAVRPALGQEDTLAALTTGVLDAAARAGTRLLVIGGAGPLRSPSGPDRLVADDPQYVPAAWRAVATASTEQLRACERHADAAWSYLSPPALLEPGRRTGCYDRGTTTLLVGADGSSRISTEDLAVAAVDELERPGTDRHFTVNQLAVCR